MALRATRPEVIRRHLRDRQGRVMYEGYISSVGKITFQEALAYARTKAEKYVAGDEAIEVKAVGVEKDGTVWAYHFSVGHVD